MKIPYLLSLALFASCAFAHECSSLPPVVRQQPSNQITTANLAGFSAPPTVASPWTPGSYVAVNSLGTGPQMLFVSVNTASGSGTIGVFASLDGKTLLQLPNSGITRLDTGAAGAISASVNTIYTLPAPPGVLYVAASAWSGGAVTVTAVAGSAPGPGWEANLLAASQLGAASGVYAPGAHRLAQVVAENGSSATVYLQVYDAAAQPTSGAIPVAEFAVDFGLSTAPTPSRVVLAPNWAQCNTGVWFCFATAPGPFNASNLVPSASGLLVRIYGQ